MSKVFVIAEAGVNHNGCLDLAYKMIDAAVEAKVDCIKFQTFITEDETSIFAEKANYQKEMTGDDENQYEMSKKLELSFDEFCLLKQYCDKKGIMFLSTAFDSKSIRFLEKLDMAFWKIPSSDVNNLPYLIQIAQTHKDVVLSTGMTTMDDIEYAVNILRQYGAGDISILHCTTDYPAKLEEVNLKVLETLKAYFKCRVGYSDHTQGIVIPIAAVAMGATIIEKHFTLNRNMEGPDHKASLEPNELALMVENIRKVELALGDGEKYITKSERKNIIAARKSIVAKRNIKRGEVFSLENVTTKRPGGGISPVKWFDILGQKAKRDFRRDEFIEL